MATTEGFKSYIMPTLTVKNATAAIEFYKRAFGAIVLMENIDTDGSVVAELSVQGAMFVVADEAPDHNNLGPDKFDGVCTRIGLMVADPDQLAERAVIAGAQMVYAVADQPYGYRLGHFIDPFGHHWEIGKPL
jgi:PhnB protein